MPVDCCRCWRVRSDSRRPILVVSTEMLGKWFTICSPARNFLQWSLSGLHEQWSLSGLHVQWSLSVNVPVVNVLAGLHPLESEGGGGVVVQWQPATCHQRIVDSAVSVDCMESGTDSTPLHTYRGAALPPRTMKVRACPLTPRDLDRRVLPESGLQGLLGEPGP